MVMINNNILYAAENRNIYQLTAGNYKLIKSTPVRVVPTKFFINNEHLYFWGRYNYDGYILDKIKL